MERDASGMNIDIPGYDIEGELGRGAMATVYLAIQRSLERRVALKVLRPALTTDPALCERFVREGRVLAQITHAHVLTIFDVGQIGDVYYMAMEYIAGGTLQARIESGMQADDAMRVLREIADALVPVHGAGVIHRDIKPSNILFRQSGMAVLSDFGIVKLLDGTALTETDFSPGSPWYMSPEQARGQKLDHRSDLYSLSIVLHEMLTGKVPFRGSDTVSTALMHCTAPVPRLAPSLAVYQALIDRLLAKEPQQRMPSAQALLDYDLDEEGKRLGLIAGGTIHRSERHKATGSPAIEPVAEGKKDQSPRFRWGHYAGVLLGLAVLGFSLRAILMSVPPVVVEPASPPIAPAPPVVTAGKPSLPPVPPVAETMKPQPASAPAPAGPTTPVAQSLPPAAPDRPAEMPVRPDPEPTRPFAVFRDTLKDGTPRANASSHPMKTP